jgi:hypothetical protein
MARLDAPRAPLLLVTIALALGCAVGDNDDGFSSGPALTFGNVSSASGTPADTSDTDDGDSDSATTAGTGNASADGNDGPVDTGSCTPSAELCNGLDDDCDGQIDNGNPESGQPCQTGNAGVCAAGVTTCEAGALACAPSMSASAEVCDGLDNDCNGQIDDGVGGGQACNTGMPGICADGQTSCANGSVECIPVTGPQAESCNGVDDDCNGQVDNGNPGGGGACNTGMPGICAAGTTQCSGGGLVCQQNQGAGNEVCGNGLDDNCNGQVDEGCNTCAHDLCVTGVALTLGCHPCVNQVCAIDPFCCNTSWDGICVGEVTSICGIPC